jgi:hypothetical protein
VTGLTGNAVDLDGVNDHVRLPTGVVSGLTRITLAAWVRLGSVVNWTRIFDFGSNTSVNMFLTPRSGITSLPAFAITTSGSGGEQRINSSVAISPNTWTHVAVTLGGGTGILYINGVEVGRNNGMSLTPSSLGATTQNYIGRSQYNGDAHLSGRVDDFRVYDDALTAAEVAALANPVPGAASISPNSGIEASDAAGLLVSLESINNTDETLLRSELPTTLIVDASGRDFVRHNRSGAWPQNDHNDIALNQIFEATDVRNHPRSGDGDLSNRYVIDNAISELGVDSDRWFRSLHDELICELVDRAIR